MERFLMKQLVEWKNAEQKKPLILEGARQVGKTWLLKEFGKTYFEHVAYFSFDKSEELKNLFLPDCNTNRILEGLSVLANATIQENNTLLILDEIQECPKAITSLKYFCEDQPNLPICAAGSLLGLTLREGSGFPVGKVDMLKLFPLSFREYLDAIGQQRLRKLIDAADWQLLATFHEMLLKELRTYYFVGGMPEAVVAYLKERRIADAQAKQKNIIRGYEFDISKHLTPVQTQTTLLVYKDIPAQLAKQNKRFIFESTKKGGYATQLGNAVIMLEQAGLVNKVEALSQPALPLASHAKSNTFKLFNLDVGLMSYVSEVSPALILADHANVPFKGAIAEQFIAQELTVRNLKSPYYWSGRAQRNNSEVDFVFQTAGRIYVVEVKAGFNVASKALKAAHERFEDTVALRFSARPFKDEGWVVNYPLYAVGSPKLLG